MSTSKTSTLYWFLGFGFLWYCWFVAFLFPDAYGDQIALIVPRGASLLATVISLIIGILLNKKPLKKKHLVAPFCVAAVLISIGTACSYYGPAYFGWPPLIRSFLSMVYGLGTGFCFFMFFRLLPYTNLKDARFVLAASVLFGAVAYAIAMLVYHNNLRILFGIIETIYPLILIPIYIKCTKILGHSAYHEKTSLAASPLRISIGRLTTIMLVFGLLLGLNIGYIPAENFLIGDVAAAIASVLALLGFLFYLRKRSLVSNILTTCQVGLGIGIIGLMMSLTLGYQSVISFSLFIAGDVLFFTTVFVFYTTISRYQSIMDPSVVLTIALITDCLGLCIGMTVRLGFFAQLGDDVLVGIRFVAVCFMLFAIIFFFNKKTLFPVAPRDTDWSLKDEARYNRCIQLAVEHNLTPRQEEIFILLVQGHRPDAIAINLTLSSSTVRTHVNQIYQKLGVHSNKELISLVQDTP